MANIKSTIKFVLSVVIWAIVARITLPIKAMWAKSGKYPGIPLPNSKEEKKKDKINLFFNSLFGGVLEYLYEKKKIGTMIYGVVSDRGSNKVDILRMIYTTLEQDTITAMPIIGVGHLILVHGTPSGHVFYRDMGETKPVLRYPEFAFGWADKYTGRTDKYMISCFNVAKQHRINYEGGWNYINTGDQNTPMALAVVGDGQVLVTALPRTLTKIILGF